MKLRSLLFVTALAHGCLALAIAAHASLTDRDAGRWPLITLAVGVVGVAGYWRSGGNASVRP